MLKINGDGAVQSCFNAATGSRTPPCGYGVGKFAPGWFFVNFGFDMRFRPVTLTVQNGCCLVSVIGNYALTGGVGTFPNAIDVVLSEADGETSGVTLTDRPFSLIVY